MAQKETAVYRKLEQDKQLHGWRLFRHQVGRFFQGEIFQGQLKNGQLVTVIKNCRTITIGEPGEPDLFAIIPKKINPEDVGKTIGQFAGIEVKTLSYKTVKKNQLSKLHGIIRNGGRGFVCRETENGYDLQEIIL